MIHGSFTDAAGSSNDIASNGRMINGLGSVWKEAVMAYFKVTYDPGILFEESCETLSKHSRSPIETQTGHHRNKVLESYSYTNLLGIP
jgi:hypothetical protein